MRLSDFSTLTFDCYGTLIDWESGIWDALQPLLVAAGREDLEREAALAAFARLESAEQARSPGKRYDELLASVHAALARESGLSECADLDRDFGASVAHWPAFPDTADSLRFLARRYKLVILSNVHRAGFAASNRKLGVRFDAVYTAEDIGSYKPNPANFEFMTTRLATEHGVPSEAILHTAQSLFHDHVPAARHGLARAWIDRQGLAGGDRWGATARVEQRPELHYVFPSLAAMCQAVTEGR